MAAYPLSAESDFRRSISPLKDYMPYITPYPLNVYVDNSKNYNVAWRPEPNSQEAKVSPMRGFLWCRQLLELFPDNSGDPFMEGLDHKADYRVTSQIQDYHKVTYPSKWRPGDEDPEPSSKQPSSLEIERVRGFEASTDEPQYGDWPGYLSHTDDFRA